jgi:ankyrin repeat protein
MTPLLVAASTGEKEQLQMLLEKGSNISETDCLGKTALHLAVENSDLEMIKFLLEDEKLDVNVRSSQNQTGLHLACYHGNLSVIQNLIDKGAIIDAKDEFGAEPIHYAAAYGFVPVLDLFIRKGILFQYIH